MLCVHNMKFKRIGKGSSGTVYRSSFQDGYVVKLMYNKELAQEEKSVLEQVDKLDPHSIFHYPIIKTLSENYNLKLCLDCSEQKKLKPCNHIDCEYSIPIVYEDGGNSLENYLEIRNVSGYRLKNIQNFYLGIWRLFYGVYVMSQNNCYHLDIKPSNITIKETDTETIVKLIDYGLFHTEKTITEEISKGGLGWLFGDGYFYHPPESSLIISESLGTVPMSYVYGRFVKGFEESLRFAECYQKLAPYFSTQKIDKFKFEIDRQTYTTDVGYRVTINFKSLYSNIDTYMLGLSLKAIVSNIKDYDLSETDREFTIQLDDLTSKMCSMYVGERIKPQVAFEKYLHMLKAIYDVDMTDLLSVDVHN
jgi:serine/threonine protein kinase